MRASLRRTRGLIAGGLIVGCLVLVALLSLVWTPLPPGKLRIALKLKAPLAEGLFGTDHLGRDVASLLMAGAWNSLSISVLSVAAGAAIGTLIGVTAAARRGWFEAIAMRVSDVIFAVPPILSAMMLGAVMGSGRSTAIFAIAVFLVPVFARVTAAAALQVWSRDFVRAAISIGKGQVAITRDHVLPNIAGPIIVQVAIQIGLAILTEAGLSFLGLGLAPPAPSWGRMLADAQTYLATAPWLALLPGLAIALTVFGFNLIGDGLRDLLDPRDG